MYDARVTFNIQYIIMCACAVRCAPTRIQKLTLFNFNIFIVIKYRFSQCVYCYSFEFYLKVGTVSRLDNLCRVESMHAYTNV